MKSSAKQPLQSAILLLVVCLSLLPNPVLSAEPPTPREAGSVTSLSGQASVAHRSEPSLPLRFKDSVYLGDRINTAPNSLARVLLGGKALVTIRERSIFYISEEKNRSTIDMVRGQLSLAVARPLMAPGEIIEIRTPNAIAAVRGTVLVVEVEPPASGVGTEDPARTVTKVTVLKGFISLSNLSGPQTTITLNANQMVNVTGQRMGAIQPVSPEAAAQLVNAFQPPLPIPENPTQTAQAFASGEMAKAMALAKYLAPDAAQQEQPGNSGNDPSLADASAPLLLQEDTGGTSASMTLTPSVTGGTSQSQPSIVSTTQTTAELQQTISGPPPPSGSFPTTLSAGTLTVNAPTNVSTFTQTGGTLTGPASLSIAGLLAWSNGTQNGAGSTVANNGLDLGGATGNQTLDQRTLQINNTAVTNSGTFTASNGAVIQGTQSTLLNNGTLTVTGPGMTTIGIPVTNSGSGNINVQSGTLVLPNGNTHTGNFTIANNATLQFDGPGTTTLDTGTYNANATGNTVLNGGNLTVNLFGTLASLGALTITSGTLTLTDNELIATIPSLTVGGAANITGLAQQLNVTGATTKTEQGIATIDLPFNSTGGVNVSGGRLDLTNSGSYTGALDVANGAELVFNGGTHNLNAGTTLTGAGTVFIGGGAANVNASGVDRLSGTLLVAGGPLSANGDLASLMSALNPTGTMVDVVGGGTLTVNGSIVNLPVVGDALNPSGGIFHQTGGTVTAITGLSLATDSSMVVGNPTPALTASASVGSGPDRLAITPDGTRAYVPNRSVVGTVSVLNLDSQSDDPINTEIAAITAGSNPTSVAITPNGTKVYVANFSSDNISVIDTATNQVTTTIPLASGALPSHVAITPDGSRAYVTNFASSGTLLNTVSVIDTATNSVIGTPISVGGRPNAIAITPDGTRAYVTRPFLNNVVVIDTATNTVIGSPIPVGTQPAVVAVSPDGTRAYVANFGGTTVSVINTVTNTVLATVPVGSAPNGLAISPDGTRVYVSNNGSNTVSAIDTATNTAFGLAIPVGNGPAGVAFTPDGSKVLVGNFGGTTVSVIENVTAPLFQVAGGTLTLTGNLVSIPDSASLTLAHPLLDIIGTGNITSNASIVDMSGALTLNGRAPLVKIGSGGSLILAGVNSHLVNITAGEGVGALTLPTGSALLAATGAGSTSFSSSLVNITGGVLTANLGIGNALLQLSGRTVTVQNGALVTVGSGTFDAPTGHLVSLTNGSTLNLTSGPLITVADSNVTGPGSFKLTNGSLFNFTGAGGTVNFTAAPSCNGPCPILVGGFGIQLTGGALPTQVHINPTFAAVTGTGTINGLDTTRAIIVVSGINSQVFLGSASLVIPPDQTINTDQTFASATQSSGTLSGTGTVTVLGPYIWTGSPNAISLMSGTGTTIVAGNATASGPNLFLDRPLQIAVGGSLDLADTTVIGPFNNTSGMITALGSLRKTIGPGTATINSVGIQGNIQATSGILSLSNLTLTGDVVLTGTGLHLNNGTVTTPITPITIAGPGTLNLDAGTLAGAGNVTISSGFAWTGNVNNVSLMSGTGTTIVAGNATASGPNLFLDRPLQIAVGGSLDLADTTVIGPFSNTSGTIEALGTLRKTTGPGTATINGVGVSGNIQVDSGVLALGGTGSLGTTHIVAGAGEVDVTAGTRTVATGTTLTVDGKFVLNGGGLDIQGASTVTGPGSFQLGPGGTLAGAGNLTISSGFAWTGNVNNVSLMSGTGTTIVAGNATASGPNLFLDRPLQIAVGGSLDLADTTVIGPFNNTSGTITALGSLRKTTGGNTANINIGTSIGDTGTLDIQTGALALRADGVSTGRFTVASGATLAFSGGTHDLNAGAILAGAGTVAIVLGSVHINTDGADRLTGTLAVLGNGTLTVTGDLVSLPTGQLLNPITTPFNFAITDSVTVAGTTSDLVDVAGGAISLTGSLLTMEVVNSNIISANLSIEANLVNVTAGGQLIGTANVPLVQFTSPGPGSPGSVSVGTTNQQNLFTVDGAGSSMSVVGTLLSSANTNMQLGLDLLQVRNHASFTSQSTSPLFEFSGGSLETAGFFFDTGTTTTIGGSLFKATNTVLTLPPVPFQGPPLTYVELFGATVNLRGSVLDLTNSSLNLTSGLASAPVIQLFNGSTLHNTVGPLIVVAGEALETSSLLRAGVDFPSPNLLDIQGPLLDLSSATVTTTSSAIILDSATVAQVGGGIRAVNSSLSVNQTLPLFDLRAGTSFTSTGPALELTNTSLNLGTLPFDSMTGGSHITSTGPVFKITGGSFTAGSLDSMDGTGNSITRTGTLFDLTNTTVTLGSITTFSGPDSISITLSPGQANVQMTDSNITLTGPQQDLSVLGGLNIAPATHAGVALIATDTVGPPDHAITVADGALARFVNGVTLSDPNAQIQLNNMTVNTTGTASVVEVGVGFPTAVRLAGTLFQATNTVLNLAPATSLLKLLPSSALTVGGHLFDLTGTNVDLTFGAAPDQPLVNLIGNNSLSLNGSFLKMNGGTLIADSFSAGGATGTLAINSNSPFVDLTNATVITTSTTDVADFGTVTATFTAGTPILRLDNSSLNMAAGNLSLSIGLGHTLGTSTGALALVATSGSSLVQNEGGLVDFRGGSTATSTAAVPLVQLTNSTVTLNDTAFPGAQNALVEVQDVGTNATINGPLLSSVNSSITINGSNGNLLAIRDGATLQTTNTTISPAINLTGGSLTLAQSAVLLNPGSTASFASPLFKAAGTSIIPGAGSPFIALNSAIGGPVTSLTVGGPLLDLTNSNLDLTLGQAAQPVLKLTGGSSFANTVAPLIRMNGGALTADALVITDSTGNSFSTAGTILDLTNATVTMRTIGEEQAAQVFVDTFTISLGVNEPFYRLDNSSIRFSDSNDSVNLSQNGGVIGIQGGATLIASNNSGYITAGSLLELENITYTDPNPQIQLTNSVLRTVGTRSLVDVISSTPTVTGPLLIATSSTVFLPGGLLSVVPGAQLTTPTTSPLFALSGGSHSIANGDVGAAAFNLNGIGTALQPVFCDCSDLELGTTPAIHGGTVTAPAPLAVPLLRTVGATVDMGTVVRVDTALLEATAPLIHALSGSAVTVTGTAFQVGTSATLRDSGVASSAMLFLDGSTFQVNNGPLFSLTGSVGSFLHTVFGDLLFLTNGSSLNVTDPLSGFLIQAAGNSVVNINGGLVRFGTDNGNSIVVQNTVQPTNHFIVGGFDFPVSLVNGALPSQVTILGTPIKNLANNTITLTNDGSLFQLSGTNAQLVINGN